MPIRYLFKQLFLPPGGLLLLLLAAWWLRRRAPRLAVLCFCLGFAGLWLMSLPVVVEQAARALEPASVLPAAEWSQLGQRAEAALSRCRGCAAELDHRRRIAMGDGWQES